MGNFDIKKKIAYKFSLEKIEDNRLKYKVMADKAAYDTISGKWTLSNYVERFIIPEESLNRGKTKDTTLVLKPRDLYNIKEEFEEMMHKRKCSSENLLKIVDWYKKENSPSTKMTLLRNMIPTLDIRNDKEEKMFYQ